MVMRFHLRHPGPAGSPRISAAPKPQGVRGDRAAWLHDMPQIATSVALVGDHHCSASEGVRHALDGWVPSCDVQAGFRAACSLHITMLNPSAVCRFRRGITHREQFSKSHEPNFACAQPKFCGIFFTYQTSVSTCEEPSLAVLQARLYGAHRTLVLLEIHARYQHCIRRVIIRTFLTLFSPPKTNGLLVFCLAL